MDIKKIAIAVLLLGAALAIAHWRYAAYQSNRAALPIGERVTLTYDGPLSGLFEQISAQTGAHYQLDPIVAQRPFKGSFTNKTLYDVQAAVAKAAGVGYSPPPPGSTAIQVVARK